MSHLPRRHAPELARTRTDDELVRADLPRRAGALTVTLPCGTCLACVSNKPLDCPRRFVTDVISKTRAARGSRSTRDAAYESTGRQPYD